MRVISRTSSGDILSAVGPEIDGIVIDGWEFVTPSWPRSSLITRSVRFGSVRFDLKLTYLITL